MEPNERQIDKKKSVRTSKTFTILGLLGVYKNIIGIIPNYKIKLIKSIVISLTY